MGRDGTHSRVTVTVDDDYLAEADQVADRLRAAGMNVEQVLPTVGIITGVVNTAQRPAIAATPGVAAVEDETSFQIAPPEADIQ